MGFPVLLTISVTKIEDNYLLTENYYFIFVNNEDIHLYNFTVIDLNAFTERNFVPTYYKNKW